MTGSTYADGWVQLLDYEGNPHRQVKPCIFALNDDWVIRGRQVQFKPGKGIYVGFKMATAVGTCEVLFDEPLEVPTDEHTLDVDPWIKLTDLMTAERPL